MSSTNQGNKLVKEKSPYLLQHCYNPVLWYPWGEEAFQKSKQLNRPIFLSVGYSTCHWCHVMEHESFENKDIAKILNDKFISIKVDREERPDVDKMYMNFVLIISGGRGGWPMSVFLTPNLEPITGGTYFPPNDFAIILKTISNKWESGQNEISETVKKTLEVMRHHNLSTKHNIPDSDKIDSKCFSQLNSIYDNFNGGFGKSTKFPKPVDLDFLLNFFFNNKTSAEGKLALEMVTTTLEQMSRGGIYDHLGKGFHRYSVDKEWRVPHFEKMLYDQGQLLKTYSNMYQINGRFMDVVEGIVDYLNRDLSHKEGGFYSAEDADSYPNHGAEIKKEGAFYVWKKAEIEELLSNKPARHNENLTLDEMFCSAFNVFDKGNVPTHLDPHGDLTEQNVLKMVSLLDFQNLLEEWKLNNEQSSECLNDAKEILLKRRNTRPHPHLDDKILTAWNALTISGLCSAAAALPHKRLEYIKRAEEAVAFIQNYLFIKEGVEEPNAELLRSVYVDKETGNITQSSIPIKAFLYDYSFLIQALLDLYELNFDEKLLILADELQTSMDKIFYDTKNELYLFNRVSDKSIIIRLQDEHEGAEPSANSVVTSNLLRISALFNDVKLQKHAENCLKSAADNLASYPAQYSKMVIALSAWQHSMPQIVIIGRKNEKRTQEFFNLIWAKFLPIKMLAFLDLDGGKEQFLLTRNSHLMELFKRCVEKDQSTALVCRNYSCDLPAYTEEDLQDRLANI